MAEWHVYDKTGAHPTVFENQFLFWKHLNSLPAGTGVVVKHYERVLRDTQAYGDLPGASPLPPDPPDPPPSETVNIAHVKPKKP